MTVYAVHHFTDSPRVKPLARWYDAFFGCWGVDCRVTSRTSFYYSVGESITVREGALFTRRSVGSFGRLFYSAPFDCSVLPVVKGPE